MNSGLRDATDLGWKLVLVLAGRAHPRILETYGQERRNHDRFAADQVSQGRHPLRAHPAHRIFPGARRRPERGYPQRARSPRLCGGRPCANPGLCGRAQDLEPRRAARGLGAGRSPA
ncbi:MAG: hypothetical protein EXR27_16770 [Betaproteobacteria bacterium]|nr:hypothetical protein [Betaproteobacteria bacterium]